MQPTTASSRLLFEVPLGSVCTWLAVLPYQQVFIREKFLQVVFRVKSSGDVATQARKIYHGQIDRLGRLLCESDNLWVCVGCPAS